MESFSYPMKKYRVVCQSLVDSKIDFSVEILKDKHRRLIIESGDFLMDREGEKSSYASTLYLFLLMFPFVVVHYFALGNGYSQRCIDKGDTLTIEYIHK